MPPLNSRILQWAPRSCLGYRRAIWHTCARHSAHFCNGAVQGAKLCAQDGPTFGRRVSPNHAPRGCGSGSIPRSTCHGAFPRARARRAAPMATIRPQQGRRGAGRRTCAQRSGLGPHRSCALGRDANAALEHDCVATGRALQVAGGHREGPPFLGWSPHAGPPRWLSPMGTQSTGARCADGGAAAPEAIPTRPSKTQQDRALESPSKLPCRACASLMCQRPPAVAPGPVTPSTAGNINVSGCSTKSHAL